MKRFKKAADHSVLRFVKLLLVTALLSSITGCAVVKPWQRETLADSIMRPDRDPMGSGLIDHVYFSREAASGGRTVGGGGCGCN